jgi:ABC-type glutathione transport system ATPase component
MGIVKARSGRIEVGGAGSGARSRFDAGDDHGAGDVHSAGTRRFRTPFGTTRRPAAQAPADGRRIQLIPQDPYASLNPRMRVGDMLAEAIDPRRGRARDHRPAIEQLLATVTLDPDAADRYPHEFSGGQRQRIAIARALAPRPSLIIADEITSALDCSVQAEILNVLRRLRAELQLTMLFISHDLAVVRHVSDEVAVLQAGRIVEHGPRDRLFDRPEHEYTRLLLASALS